MKLPSLPLRSSPLNHLLGHHSAVLARAAAVGLVLALLAALAWRGSQAYQTNRTIAVLQTQQAALSDQQALSARALRSPQAVSETERRGLAHVVRQLNTPWQDLFDQLERATPKDVALLSIEPDAGRASVRLQAEGRKLETLLAYAAALQQQGVLGRLTYSKHETNEQDSNKPVRLSVELELRMPERLRSGAPL